MSPGAHSPVVQEVIGKRKISKYGEILDSDASDNENDEEAQ